jgi:hypothetical protein
MPIEGTYMSTSTNSFDASEELMAMILKAVNFGVTMAEGKEKGATEPMLFLSRATNVRKRRVSVLLNYTIPL